MLVGCAAAAVHWSVVVGLVAHAGWRPLGANVVGWLVALLVSYGGHQQLSFAAQGAAARSSAPRFFLVSALGFMVNESVYAMALHWSGWRYDAVLGAVLLGVAALTYLASRHWAFAGSPAD